MRNPPTPREVRALRLDVVRVARVAIKLYCGRSVTGRWVGIRERFEPAPWVWSEVRTIRRLILDDLAALEYELRHGLRKKRRRK